MGKTRLTKNVSFLCRGCFPGRGSAPPGLTRRRRYLDGRRAAAAPGRRRRHPVQDRYFFKVSHNF